MSHLDEHLSVKSVVTSGQERALSSESFSADSGERTKTTSQRSSSPNTTHQLPPTVAAVCHHLGVWSWSTVSMWEDGASCQTTNCPRLTSMKQSYSSFSFLTLYSLTGTTT